MINIAIMGFGTIGSGVAELLMKNQKSIVAKSGQASLDIKYILDIRDFPDSPYADKFTKNFDDILNDPEVTIVAEVIGGMKFSYGYVKACLENGKNVYPEELEYLISKSVEGVAEVDNGSAVASVIEVFKLVELDEELLGKAVIEKDEDNQLQKALEVLEEKIKTAQ